MRTSINTWLEKALETGMVGENQIIVVYDKNNNIEYLGKADFAPLTLWDDFKTATVVGNELHINERQCDAEQETTEHEAQAKVLTWDQFRDTCYEDACNWFNSGYIAKELSEDDILNEYPDDYFTDTTETECNELSNAFTPTEFASKTLEYLTEMENEAYENID